MNPRQDAAERLDCRYEVRVLEPSPPAVYQPPWFADDPVARGDVPDGRLLASPVSSGDVLWHDLCQQDPALAEWCGARWLGAWRRLPELPPHLAATVEALHTLAEHVVAPARFDACGKVGLRYTVGGFGTPFFGDDQQLRVEGTDLVSESARAPLTTLGDAVLFAGVQPGVAEGVLFPDVDFDPALDIAVDPMAARFVGEWLGFAASVLEETRVGAATATRVQLMPETFDLGFDRGGERFTTLGASLSPPHLFVRPWVGKEVRLDFSTLAAAPDQRAAALLFFQSGERE